MMIKEKILERLFQIVSSMYENEDNIPEIGLKTKIAEEGLGFSSIDSVIFVLRIEKEFTIKWPDEYLIFDSDIDIKRVVDIIYELQSSKSG